MADAVVASAASAGFVSVAGACLQASEKKRNRRPCLEESTLDSQDCKDCRLRELTLESLCGAGAPSFFYADDITLCNSDTAPL